MGSVTGLVEQQHAALSLTINRAGHLTDRCSHGQWLRGWGSHTRHDCDVPGCDRTGAPCTAACQAVRRALKAGEALVEKQGVLL